MIRFWHSTKYSNYLYFIRKHTSVYYFNLADICLTQLPRSMSTDATKQQTSGDIFYGAKDRFKGITINLSEVIATPNQPDEFLDKLSRSLTVWENDEVPTVWFQIPLELSENIPFLVTNGFVFHHATFDGKSVFMYKWMRDSPSRIPEYSHTMVGVGAVVVNSKQELLVVKEVHNAPLWKLPGGYVDPDEDIGPAAEREVFEETGIVSQFESLISFRHTHKVNFGCSDLYFIAKLTPTCETIKCDNVEINQCRWMAIDEYLNSSEAHQLNKDTIRHYLECEENNFGLKVKKGEHPTLKKAYSLYQIDCDLER